MIDQRTYPPRSKKRVAKKNMEWTVEPVNVTGEWREVGVPEVLAALAIAYARLQVLETYVAKMQRRSVRHA